MTKEDLEARLKELLEQYQKLTEQTTLCKGAIMECKRNLDKLQGTTELNNE